MAGFITMAANSPDREWSSANWIFVGFLDHAMHLTVDDAEVFHELSVCKHSQSVDLNDLAKEYPERCKRVLSAFTSACSQIAKGNRPVSVNGTELDEGSQIQYRDAIGRLEKLFILELGEEDGTSESSTTDYRRCENSNAFRSGCDDITESIQKSHWR